MSLRIINMECEWPLTSNSHAFRIGCFRHLETTPFCPADIFPREGARSYRRMGIIAIFFCASLPLAPSRGKGWGLASA